MPAMLYTSGKYYHYMTNSRGDVVAMFDTTGTELARYSYDAWGNCTVTTPTGAALTDANHIANINPLRYRGYYLDTDTGFYYLQSRYYDPQTCRFVNADSENILGIQDDLCDKNLFAYCDNNPIIRIDDDGEIWHVVIGAGIGALVNAAITVVSNVSSGDSWSDGLGTALLTGAASGGLAVTGVGLLGQIAGNAALGAGSELISQGVSGQKVNIGKVFSSGVVGGISGLIGGKGLNASSFKGIYKNAVSKLATAKSIKKVAMYAGKKAFVKTSVSIGTGRFFAGGVAGRIISATDSYIRNSIALSNSKKSMGYYYSTGRR